MSIPALNEFFIKVNGVGSSDKADKMDNNSGDITSWGNALENIKKPTITTIILFIFQLN